MEAGPIAANREPKDVSCVAGPCAIGDRRRKTLRVQWTYENAFQALFRKPRPRGRGGYHNQAHASHECLDG